MRKNYKIFVNFCKNKFKKHFSFLYCFLCKKKIFLLEKYKNSKLKHFNGIVLFNFCFSGVKFKIFLDRKNGYIDETIFLKGVFESGVLRMYKKKISNGGVYIDIGTNIGQHALYASNLVGEDGVVVCFEPVKSLFDQLCKSIEINSFNNFIVYNKAIGNNVGKEVIYKDRDNIGASSLVKKNDNYYEDVIVTDGRELASLNKIDFIKIDTEGYETIVLKQIMGYIDKFKPILFFEFTPMYYEEKTQILKQIHEMNYKMYDFEDECTPIENIESWFEEFDRIQTNILCIYRR